jgi:outer membrane protein assembly factor BamA
MRAQAVRVFRSIGHLEPRIEIEAGPPVAGGAYDRRIVIRGEAGPRVELEAPRFAGIPAEESAFVARRFWAPVQRAELAVGEPEADRRALQALGELGYVEPGILGRRRDGPVLEIELAAGARRRLSGLAVEGLPAGVEVALTLGAGDPLRADRLGAAVLSIERALAARGHLDAMARLRTAAEPDDPLAVAVTIEVEPGPRSDWTAVEFEGLASTRPRWAEHLAGLPLGEPARVEELQAARRRLYGTGLFSSVGYRLEPTGGEGAAAVFEMEELPRFRVAYGFRWDSEADVSALVEAEDRNFLGRNLRLGLRALWAGDDRSARGFLQVPSLFRTRGSFELFALSSREVAGGLIRDRLQSTLQFSWPFSSELTGRLYARYQDDELSEVDPDPFFPILERIRSPILGLQLLYDARSRPDDGLFASLDLSGADDRIGGDFSYARAFAQVSWFLPAGRVGARRLTWAQSYRLGLAEALDDQVLIFENRFFTGGAYSVRGYDLDVLGPTERLGTVVRAAGGEALLVVNQELRVQVSESLTGLLFADFGNVWADSSELGSDVARSLGIGVRAATPLGLFRLDVAYPLDPIEDAASYKLHFGLGNVF